MVINMENINEILKGSNVKIDELSKYISKSGVCVHPRIGRKRNKVSLPKALMGTVSAADEAEDTEFYNEYINQGTISLIPKSDEKKLISIETSVRSKVSQLAIACDNTFMTADVYANEYLPYFNQKKKEYFEKRDEIVAKWDLLVDVFKTKLNAYFDRRNIINKQELMKNIISNIPTKNEFSSSFYMELRLTAFPVEENIDMFSSTLAAQVKNSITETKMDFIVEMMGNLLGDAFNNLNKMLLFYRDNGEIKNQQMKYVKTMKKSLVKNNLLGLDMINDIINDITALENISIDEYDEIAENAESILVKTYGFIKDTNLDSFIDTTNLAITEMDMARAYVMINPNSTVVKSMLNMDTEETA